jgi:hypothetical protein
MAFIHRSLRISNRDVYVNTKIDSALYHFIMESSSRSLFFLNRMLWIDSIFTGSNGR